MKATILVDSCSYFRLAQNIHPLLKTPFCEEKHVMSVIKELNDDEAKQALAPLVKKIELALVTIAQFQQSLSKN